MFYTVITRMTCIETEYVISIYHFTTHGGQSHKLLSLDQQSSCYMCLVQCGDTCYSVCWTWKCRLKKKLRYCCLFSSSTKELRDCLSDVWHQWRWRTGPWGVSEGDVFGFTTRITASLVGSIREVYWLHAVRDSYVLLVKNQTLPSLVGWVKVTK